MDGLTKRQETRLSDRMTSVKGLHGNSTAGHMTYKLDDTGLGTLSQADNNQSECLNSQYSENFDQSECSDFSQLENGNFNQSEGRESWDDEDGDSEAYYFYTDCEDGRP